LSRSEAVADARQKNSQLDAANAALTESRESLRLILDSTAEAIFGSTWKTGVPSEQRCLDLLGYTDQADIIGKEIHKTIHSLRPENTPLPIAECNIVNTYTKGAAAHSENEVFVRRDASTLEVEYYPTLSTKTATCRRRRHVCGQFAKKAAAEADEYYGSHDSLTGLMNRRHFYQELSRADIKDNLPVSSSWPI
jgi:PAS domain-containing protein